MPFDEAGELIHALRDRVKELERLLDHARTASGADKYDFPVVRPVPPEDVGVRPAYPPGSLVTVGRCRGLIRAAQTLADGSVDWGGTPRSVHYDHDMRLLPIPSAGRPRYAVDWFDAPTPLHTSWWYAEQFDSVVVNPLAPTLPPWAETAHLRTR